MTFQTGQLITASPVPDVHLQEGTSHLERRAQKYTLAFKSCCEFDGLQLTLDTRLVHTAHKQSQ